MTQLTAKTVDRCQACDTDWPVRTVLGGGTLYANCPKCGEPTFKSYGNPLENHAEIAAAHIGFRSFCQRQDNDRAAALERLDAQLDA